MYAKKYAKNKTGVFYAKPVRYNAIVNGRTNCFA